MIIRTLFPKGLTINTTNYLLDVISSFIIVIIIQAMPLVTNFGKQEDCSHSTRSKGRGVIIRLSLICSQDTI